MPSVPISDVANANSSSTAFKGSVGRGNLKLSMSFRHVVEYSLRELKKMVAALHEAGLEVNLDVVYRRAILEDTEKS